MRSYDGTTALLLFSLLASLVAVPTVVNGQLPEIDQHFYAPPNDLSERGPCPALNTLANHGYINRDGKNISVDFMSVTLEKVFGLSFDDASLIALSAVLNGVTYSVDTGGGFIFDLFDLYKHNTLGTTLPCFDGTNILSLLPSSMRNCSKKWLILLLTTKSLLLRRLRHFEQLGLSTRD